MGDSPNGVGRPAKGTRQALRLPRPGRQTVQVGYVGRTPRRARAGLALGEGMRMTRTPDV